MPEPHPTILILACSPQAGGNTDAAASVLQRVLAETRHNVELVYLRDKRVLPCRGCNACAAPGNACVLAGQDEVQPLLERLCAVEMVFWLSPIYFYHLPAQAKALIDRAQARWQARRQRAAASLPLPTARRIHPLLIAARSAGDNLFKGSLYTLQYFSGAFGLALGEPLLLTGLDRPGDLAVAVHEHEAIAAWARKALSGRES